MEGELIITPLRSALQMRQPLAGLIIHSERGGQYVSTELKELISLWHIRPSMTGPPLRSGRRSLRQCFCRVVMDGVAHAAA